MGRILPTECEHGVVIDGGDFMDSQTCETCETERKERAATIADDQAAIIKDLREQLAKEQLANNELRQLVEEAYEEGWNDVVNLITSEVDGWNDSLAKQTLDGAEQ